MRGIVISPPVSLIGDRGFRITGSGLDPQLLRFWLLFWDKLDHPDSNMIGVGNSPDAEFLISAGVLQRTRSNWTGSLSNADVIVKPHLATYKYLDTSEPGVWSLATGPGTFELPEEFSEEGRALYLRLVNAIPIPNVDVPLEDVLSFKRKRSAELDAIHFHLQGLYQSNLSAPDRPLAEHEAINQLRHAANDQVRVSRESGIKARLTDFSANFDLVGALSGWQGAAQAGMDPFSSAIAGAAGLGFGFGITKAVKGRVQSTTPFGYVANFRKELFIAGE